MNKVRIAFCVGVIVFRSLLSMGQERERVLIVARGIDLPSERLVETFVDDFHDALLNATGKRYEIRNGRDEFEQMRQEHLQLQSDGYIKDEELARIGHEIGAQFVFGIVVEKDAVDNDYYFRAKVIEVERDGVPCSARYPIEVEGDEKVTELTRYNRQMIALILIDRLGFLSDEEQAFWHEKVVKLQSQKEISDNQAREAAYTRSQSLARRARRDAARNNFRYFFEEHMAPMYFAGGYLGYSPGGFKIAAQVDVKYLSLGLGTSLSSSERHFPIRSDKAVDGYFDENETYPAQYDLAGATLNFSVGLNFKYFGFALMPELYFLDRTYHWNKKENTYVAEHYGRTLITLAPSVYIHIPFNFREPCYAIMLRAGYSFAPTINYNPGFSIEIGFGGFW